MKPPDSRQTAQLAGWIFLAAIFVMATLNFETWLAAHDLDKLWKEFPPSLPSETSNFLKSITLNPLTTAFSLFLLVILIRVRFLPKDEDSHSNPRIRAIRARKISETVRSISLQTNHVQARFESRNNTYN